MLGVAWLVATESACQLSIKTNDLEGGCPRLSGPKLVKVESSSGPYCIDSTEVTNADYKAFVDAMGQALVVDAMGQPPAQIPLPGCASVTTYLPGQPWPVPGAEELPVVRANWCQAGAYCAWAGKRLCGRIGGGALLERFWNDSSQAQWFNACSHGGTRMFPYGGALDASAFDPNACGSRSVAPAGSKPGCEGGFDGLFDMSGNVWEWTDTCSPPGSANDFCHSLGGAFDSSPPNEFACGLQYRNWTRTAAAGNLGFRCCKDL